MNTNQEPTQPTPDTTSEAAPVNTQTVRMIDSYVTYESHGDLTLNYDLFPELKDKSKDEVQEWLNEHKDGLYVHVPTGEFRKDRNYIYDPEEIQEAKESGEELEVFEDDDICSLVDYWNESEVEWDKIKNETRRLHFV